MIKLEGQFFNIDRDLYVNKHWSITAWKTDYTKFYNLELTKKTDPAFWLSFYWTKSSGVH